jgi:hypothetical protein
MSSDGTKQSGQKKTNIRNSDAYSRPSLPLCSLGGVAANDRAAEVEVKGLHRTLSFSVGVIAGDKETSGSQHSCFPESVRLAASNGVSVAFIAIQA